MKELSLKNKDKLAALLLESGEEFLSGSVIAEELGISRAAVWKNIKYLEQDGYSIEGVNNKGYRLADDNDVVSPAFIEKYLGEKKDLFRAEVLESTVSTNTLLKSKADRLPDGAVIIAGNQTGGRGRAGRSFYSPSGTGIYLSVLLKRNIRFDDAGRLTCAAAAAACRAVEQCAQCSAGIKWVNDVFVNDKKVCGILTEASVNCETGVPDWIVTGIGFNVYEPEGGFPEEIAEVAGYISNKKQKDLRSRLAAAFILNFYDICEDLKSTALYEEYKARCFVPGRSVFVLSGGNKRPAEALDINEDFSLSVRYEDGSCEALNAGEVSIRPM